MLRHELQQIARELAPLLGKIPEKWAGQFPDAADFGDPGGRVAPNSLRRLDHRYIRFRSHGEIVQILGSAGGDRAWHHIVEQRLAANGRFPADWIHNTDNIINMPRILHECINAEMSSKLPYTGGLTVRQWFGADVVRGAVRFWNRAHKRVYRKDRAMRQTVDQLTNRFVTAELAAIEAYRHRDIPRHNRWYDRGAGAAKMLKESVEGRQALERLMVHPSPSVRIGAAAHVLEWAPDSAVPVIEDLLLWADADKTEGLFGESLHVGHSASGLLALHFGINILKIDNYVRAKHGLPPKKRPEWAP